MLVRAAAAPAANEIVRPLTDIDFVAIVAILAGAWLLTRGLRWFLPWVAELLPGRLRLYVLPLVPVLRLLIAFAALLLVVPQVVEPTVQNFVAVLGAAGIALGFAFKDYVSSLIAGVVAIYERPYQQGDWIELAGVYGEVREVGIRTLTLVTPDDDSVTVPHLTLWTEQVANANDGKRTLMVVTELWLEPDHDGAAVRARLQDVILTSPYLDLTRPRTVVVAERPWGTHYRLKAYPVDARDQFLFRSDLTVRAKDALRAAGVRYAVVPAVAGETDAGS